MIRTCFRDVRDGEEGWRRKRKRGKAVFPKESGLGKQKNNATLEFRCRAAVKLMSISSQC